MRNSRSRTQPSTLFLDLDGTLLGSYRVSLRIGFVVIFTAYFLINLKNPIRRLRALKYIQEALETGWARSQGLTNQTAIASIFAERVGLKLENAAMEVAQACEMTFKWLRPFFYIKQDALEFIEWAKGRYQLVLATNPFWPLSVVTRRLRWGKIDSKLFQLITCSENMNVCKPHPDYYLDVLSKSNLDPRRCVMVGNDLRKDTPAAKIGIDVFLIAETRGQREQWERQGISCGGFDDLKKKLEGTIGSMD